MGLVAKFKAAAKAAAIQFMGSAAGNWSMLLLNRSKFNYAAHVGDGRGNSIVEACVAWACRTFPEARIMVEQRDADGVWSEIEEHDLTELVASPNDFYSGELLMKATLADLMTTGNAYWIKVRSGYGKPIQLWWAPASIMEPRWPDDGSEFISFYEYRPNGVPIRYVPADIVHFRDGLDPANTRKGLGNLASLLREIFTDDEAANFTASLLRNLGVPGVIISPDDEGTTVEEEDAQEMKEDFIQKFGGDNRGEPMIMSSKAKVQVVSFSPQQMNLRDLRKIPEERVSAVLGIPAIVAGLGAGLDRSTFSNMEEARRAAYESNIIPTQRLVSGALRTQLLVEYGDLKGRRVAFDQSEVRVMREDQDKIWTRVNIGVQGGWVMVAEAREKAGLVVEDEHRIYLRPMSVTEVRAGRPPEEVDPDLEDVAPELAEANEEEEDQDPPEEEDQEDPPAEEGKKGLGFPRALPAGLEFGGALHVRLMKAYVKRADQYEQMLARQIRKLFIEQRDKILAEMGAKELRLVTYKGLTLPVLIGQKDGGTPPFNPSDWVKEFATRILPALREIVKAEGDQALADIGVRQGFDAYDPGVTRFLMGRAQRFAQKVNETTWDDLKRELTGGLEAGESTPELADRVRQLFGRYIGIEPDAAGKMARADMIARTEANGAANGGKLAAWRLSDVVEGKVWLAALDERTRDSHVQAHGQEVKLEEDFEVGFGHGPMPGQIGLPEEDINCRCSAKAALLGHPITKPEPDEEDGDEEALTPVERALADYPALEPLKAGLRVDDFELAKVDLEDLNALRPTVLRELGDSGAQVRLVRGVISDQPEFAHLKGVTPRGWPKGTTWDDADGLYSYAEKMALKVYGTGGSGSTSTLVHEVGHGIGRLLGYNDDPELIALHVKDFAHLSPYEQQGGPGGEAGRQEFLAETIAKLAVKGEYAAEQFSSPEMVKWLKDKVLKW
jgi:HK97 family phage portal protein